MGLAVAESTNVVLDCYRLARFYHVSPREFLEMPLSEVRVHLGNTIDLAHIIRDENSSDD
jgi:hypothetical protein